MHRMFYDQSMSHNERSILARKVILDVMPDLDSRQTKFTVLTEPPDESLFAIFVDYLNGALPEISNAATSGNFPELKRQAHSLKGVGGSVGFPEISALAERIEEVARAEDTPGAHTLLHALKAWFAAIQQDNP